MSLQGGALLSNISKGRSCPGLTYSTGDESSRGEFPGR
jgi:hypothetical protein